MNIPQARRDAAEINAFDNGNYQSLVYQIPERPDSTSELPRYAVLPTALALINRAAPLTFRGCLLRARGTRS